MKIVTESLKNLDNIDNIKELVSITNDFVYHLYKNNQKKLIKNKSKFLNELKQKILNKNSKLLNDDWQDTNTLIGYIGDSIFINNLHRFNNIKELDLKLSCLYRYATKLISLYDNGNDHIKNTICLGCNYVSESVNQEHHIFKAIKYNNSNFLYSFIFLLPELIFPSLQDLVNQTKSWCYLINKIEDQEQKDILKNSILDDVHRYFVIVIDNKYLITNIDIANNLFKAFIKNITTIKTSTNSIFKKYNVQKFCINGNMDYSIETLLNYIYFLINYLKNILNKQ